MYLGSLNYSQVQTFTLRKNKTCLHFTLKYECHVTTYAKRSNAIYIVTNVKTHGHVQCKKDKMYVKNSYIVYFKVVRLFAFYVNKMIHWYSIRRWSLLNCLLINIKF